MKRKRRPAGTGSPGDIAAAFTRGMVASGLLAAVQQRGHGGGRPPSMTVVRFAVQGGVALAAGSAVADAVRRHDHAAAILALAAGTAGLVVAETLLNPAADSPTPEENGDG